MRFECQRGCTECCRRDGWVYLTEADVSKAAAHLGMTVVEFETRYLYRTKNVRRLRTSKATHCPFLSEDGCAIHEAKPTQCRLFPFWPELVDNIREWHGAASWCPGIGKGDLIQIETARAVASEMREAYPAMYRG